MKITIDSETLQALVEAIECSLALEAPYKEGKAILEARGYNHDTRFELPASEFVKQKQLVAIQKVKEENIKRI